ncbi:MAG: hypothetical protein HYZ37_10530 [Candidatus Solibacter usitatus]|nr:hypothetical protein [Candidatus Solibacter usitatus]
MRTISLRRILFLGACFLLLSSLYALQQPFRVYPGFEHAGDRLPSDASEKTEWVFARLMYPPLGGFAGRRRGGLSDWRMGVSYWTMDYPTSDRHCSQLLRRLTRVHARSVEPPTPATGPDSRPDLWQRCR